MQKNKRAIAFFAAFLFVLALLSPALFVAIESHHDCTGIDCPICEQVSVCLQFLHSVARDPDHPFVAFTGFVAVAIVGALILSVKQNTLIDWKVKLSN